MTIKNLTKKTTISKNAIYAKSLLDKSLGLLKYKTPQTLILETRWGLHTFFMKYPIDILILDKENFVVRIKENLNPNNFYFWNPKYFLILELPSKTIKKSKTGLKHKISIQL